MQQTEIRVSSECFLQEANSVYRVDFGMASAPKPSSGHVTELVWSTHVLCFRSSEEQGFCFHGFEQPNSYWHH